MQSNSQRQVAAAAAKLGLACHLAVYHGRLAPPTPEYETIGQRAAQPLVRRAPARRALDGRSQRRDRGAGRPAARAKAAGPTSCRTASPMPLGAVGYASTIARDRGAIARPRRSRRPAIVHCTGSGGTQAGLVVGASGRAARDAHRRHRHRCRTRARAGRRHRLRAGPRPICSARVSTSATSRSSPGTPAPPTACRMRQRSRRSGLAGSARSAGARPGLFRQGTGRPDRAGSGRAMATPIGCHFHPYRRRTGAVRLPERARHLIGPSITSDKQASLQRQPRRVRPANVA